MKLTKKSLKALISEELCNRSTVLLEMPMPGREEDNPKAPENPGSRGIDPDGYEGEMAKRSLYHMSQQSQQLHDMLGDDENLEPWVQDKISKAADYLEAAFKAVTYDKGPGQGRG